MVGGGRKSGTGNSGSEHPRVWGAPSQETTKCATRPKTNNPDQSKMTQTLWGKHQKKLPKHTLKGRKGGRDKEYSKRKGGGVL